MRMGSVGVAFCSPGPAKGSIGFGLERTSKNYFPRWWNRDAPGLLPRGETPTVRRRDVMSWRSGTCRLEPPCGARWKMVQRVVVRGPRLRRNGAHSGGDIQASARKDDAACASHGYYRVPCVEAARDTSRPSPCRPLHGVIPFSPALTPVPQAPHSQWMPRTVLDSAGGSTSRIGFPIGQENAMSTMRFAICSNICLWPGPRIP